MAEGGCAVGSQGPPAEYRSTKREERKRIERREEKRENERDYGDGGVNYSLSVQFRRRPETSTQNETNKTQLKLRNDQRRTTPVCIFNLGVFFAVQNDDNDDDKRPT